MLLSLLLWNTANNSFMIVCIQSPPRLLMMQDQKSLTHCWLSCSGWTRERFSFVFSYKGGWFIRNWQWRAKVNILRLAAGYLNATMNWKLRNTEPEIGTDGSSQTRHHLQINGYRSGIGRPWYCGSEFWRFLNRTELFFRSEPGSVANTGWGKPRSLNRQ